jgi:hypothetical protein
MKALRQSDVALNLYDFVARRYGHPTENYGLRAYDEIILAPMVCMRDHTLSHANPNLSVYLSPV